MHMTHTLSSCCRSKLLRAIVVIGREEGLQIKVSSSSLPMMLILT